VQHRFSELLLDFISSVNLLRNHNLTKLISATIYSTVTNVSGTSVCQLTTSSSFPSITGASPFGFSASFPGSASFLASLPAGALSAFFLPAASTSFATSSIFSAAFSAPFLSFVFFSFFSALRDSVITSTTNDPRQKQQIQFICFFF